MGVIPSRGAPDEALTGEQEAHWAAILQECGRISSPEDYPRPVSTLELAYEDYASWPRWKRLGEPPPEGPPPAA